MREDELLSRLFRLASTLGAAMAEDLGARGLTQARATVLAVVREVGPCHQRVIAEALRVTPRNVTGLVDGLETGGLVERAPDPSDRRALLVSLSTAGERVAAAMERDRRELARFLFSGQPAGDLDTVAAELDRVLARLDQPEFATLRQKALDRWPDR